MTMSLRINNILRTTQFEFSRFLHRCKSTDTKDGLTITDSCVKRLKEIITDGSVLRITVDGGGCSGFIYKFDLDRNISEDDRVFGRNGVEIIIDPVSFSYIKGSVVDYEEQLIKSSFKIVNNPIADDGCSCGSSFSVKM